jgi:hypothetical protein
MIIKKNSFILFVILTGGFAGTGCNYQVISPHFNEEFYLNPGQKAEFKDSGLEITFNKVLEDSRCPEGVECVWEGNGKIELSVYQSVSGSEIKELNTALEPKQTESGNHKIRLTELQPYPKKDGEIESEKYRIRLLVEK